MTSPEMHVMFRQYAQQMGMQNVRAILPEQIDLVLNTSQMDVINQIIKDNLIVTNDRVITDNSKIGQINALKSLYHVYYIDMSPSNSVNTDPRIFNFSSADRNTGRMTTDFTKTLTHTIDFPKFMFLVDFSLNYKKVKNQQGYNGSVTNYIAPTFEEDGIETNYFPVRIIDDAYLADTLNDFVLKNRLRSPIIVTYNNNSDKLVFDLYIDKFNKVTINDSIRYVLYGDLLPYKLRMSYIGSPKPIKYDEDLLGDENQNQDCELPEYMHVDIVKHAVDLWRIAVSGSMMATQQQEQNARQENMRNNYRNEGNAQQ